jgi:hypothetical protein
MTPLYLNYQLVTVGGDPEEALAAGHLYASSLEAAKRYAQTVHAPNLPAAASALEVVLRDMGGSEVWRGLYLGHAEGLKAIPAAAG